MEDNKDPNMKNEKCSFISKCIRELTNYHAKQGPQKGRNHRIEETQPEYKENNLLQKGMVSLY